MKTIAIRSLLALLAASLLAGPGQAASTPPVPDELDLETAIGFALENNFSIRQARERIREQEGVLITVKASAIPNVSAAASYQFNEQEITTSSPPSKRGWNLSVTASQLLYAGGGVRSAIRSSELVREAALLDLQGAINSALLNVRVAFFSVLLARDKIVVQEENLRLLEQQFKTTSDRFEAGTVSGFERLRAEVAVANARAPLITARNNLRLGVEALRQALGFTTSRADASKVPEFVGTLEYVPQTFDIDAAFESARANRPELKRLAKLTDASEEGITTARSNYYPNVALVGGYQLRKGPTDRFGDSRDGLFVGLQSDWSIFDGRATAGRVRQARSIAEQTRLTFEEVELATEVEVRRAYSQWQEATELVEASSRVVGQAEEAVRLANARYSAGTSTQLDVLQAQVELTTARSNQVQAYYNYNVATASLRYAMGLTDELVTQ